MPLESAPLRENQIEGIVVFRSLRIPRERNDAPIVQIMQDIYIFNSTIKDEKGTFRVRSRFMYMVEQPF